MVATQLYERHRLQTEIPALGAKTTREIPVFSKRMELPSGPVDVDVHWVQSHGLHSSARELINKRYSWRGYGNSHILKRSSHHATFTASIEGSVMGTVTLAVDSKAGLAADSIFKEELDVYRGAEGAQICEIIKLAADGDVQSPAILAALFHVILLYGQLKYNCTNLFIEVNPRHRRFYEAMLGFERVGDLRTNASVAAPSQLMHLAVDQIRPMIEACRDAGRAAAARSLYPHFLSQREEEMILTRLSALMSQSALSGEFSGEFSRAA